LDTGNTSSLMALSPRNRHHALSALASLSKYQGRYQKFLQMRHRYNLKWTSGNDSIQSFERLFDDSGLDFDTMLARIKEMIKALPAHMAAVIRFNCLTGLRPSEACESVRLLADRDTNRAYYNSERQCLEHWRSPNNSKEPRKKPISPLSRRSKYRGLAF
jgi:hypothetical protein